MNNIYLDVHLIQTVPPSNVNRDDTGSPKSAIYGGVRRARVSSQSWKRATRVAFADLLDTSELGIRTKRVVEIVAERIVQRDPSFDQEAGSMAAEVLSDTGLKLSKPKRESRSMEEASYLVFLSRRQIERLADAAIRRRTDPEGAASKSEVQKILKVGNSIDLALFGRMVADVSDLSVDASARVAHAISVHAVENEYDYFTAVDEVKDRGGSDEDTGAGMIGTVEFNSSTLYRYATVDVRELASSLGDTEAAARGLGAFLQAFTRSMPTGKLNTFANRTLPDAVLITLRHDQPVSLVGAFETPVASGAEGGRVAESIGRLADHAVATNQAYGDGASKSWYAGVGLAVEPLGVIAERLPFDAAVRAAVAAVEDEMRGPE